MNDLSGKIKLPTVETCRWRTAGASGKNARCGLLAELTGDTDSDGSLVPHDACVACCNSFPSTRRNLNPVVAGLLFNRSSRIHENGGTDTCSVEHAEALQVFAGRFLTLDHPTGFRLTPARDSQSCFYLGDAVTTGDNSSDETCHHCQHPGHDITTPSACRACRDWTLQKPVSRFLTLSELVPLPERRTHSGGTNWAVGVTTAPRRDSTLETCLDSIIRAGWNSPRLFLDGTLGIPARFDNLSVTWREEPVGAWPAWYLALTELVLQNPDADAFVMLQDDVHLYDRESLRDYLEQVLWPGDRPGLISLFNTGPETDTGWINAHDAWHWGAQAFVIAPAVARALVADPDISHTCLAAAGNVHIPIPEILADWTARQNIEVWFPTPSLVQHIGSSSTIWMDASIVGGRRAPWFSGSLESAAFIEEPLDEFPEAAFLCPDSKSEDYTAQITRGRQTIADSTVVICGLCRDVRQFLPKTAARIERLGNMFRDYRVVLFENDSTDATREFLNDWQSQNTRVRILTDELRIARYGQIRSLDRAAHMANCRNRYREYVLEQLPHFDYVIVVDTDLPGGWSYDGIAHSFGMDAWDFVGSYGISSQPAISKEFPFCHFDVWAFHPARGTDAAKLVDHARLELHRGDAPFRVDSCFGGLGIYRMECLQACDYGGSDCEHVVLHQRMQQAGFDRLFINPNQIVLYTPM